MSHIHEALKKAQKYRDVRNIEYSGILTASRRKRRSLGRRTVQWLFPLIIIIFLAFFYDSWLDFTASETPESSEKDQQSFQTTLRGTGPKMSREIDPAQPHTFNLEKSQATTPGESQTTNLGESQAASIGRPQGIVPDKPEETYKRAMRFHKEGRLEEAKRLYEETLRLDPGYVDALNNLGVIFIRKRDYLVAQRHLEKAIRLKPGYAEPFYNLACLNAITGETRRALAYLQKAFSLNPTVRDWAGKDTDLETLRHLPEFKEIM